MKSTIVLKKGKILYKGENKPLELELIKANHDVFSSSGEANSLSKLNHEELLS